MKKGISILSLSIVIVILGVITSTVLISSSGSVKNLNKAKFLTEFMTLESAVNSYYEINGSYPILEESIDLTYDNIPVNNQFEGETITGNTVLLYKLDVATLGFDELYLGNGENEKDYYAISTTTGKLYYINGFSIDELVYYRVTQDLVEDYE